MNADNTNRTFPCRIYLTDFSQLPDLTCRQLLEALPASRRKRIQGLSHPAAIAQSVAVSALLYEALDEADGSVEGGCVIIPAAQLTAGRLEPLTKRYLLDWTPSPSGQPFPGGIAAGLGGRSSGLLYTSLSHSGVWAAAAIARCPLGLDIQSPDPLPDHRLLRIGARFHPQETAGLEQLTPAERQSAFYRLWTMKESVMKLCGAGFSLPLRSFCISREASGAYTALLSDGRRAALWPQKMEGLYLAAAFWNT